MTINEAIVQVMRDSDYPLTPKEAYDRILKDALYEFRAQKPLSIVTGQIRRHCKDLDFPSAEPTKYFGLTDDGRFYALDRAITVGSPSRRITPTRKSEAAEPQVAKRTLRSNLEAIRDLQREHTELLKDRILRDLKKLPPATFELFAKKLLDVYGFEGVRVTKTGSDGGIDGYGKLKVGLAHMGVAFQCKRWDKTSIGRPEIDKFRGAIQGQYEQGIFFTTAKFVPAATEVSIRPGAVPIILIDGPSIVQLMIDKQFGVQEEPVSVFTYALDTIITDEAG
jgi:restriction system protein